MVTLAAAVTAVVVTAKVAEVAPARTVTLAGTVATAALLLESVTTAPPAGAAEERVTCRSTPSAHDARRAEGDRGEGRDDGGGIDCQDRRTRGPSVGRADGDVGGSITPVVVTAKPTDVAPAGAVTLAGTAAVAGLLLESVTTAPPAGAAEERVTVPVDPVPPTTLAGLRETEARVATTGAGFTARIAVRVDPP